MSQAVIDFGKHDRHPVLVRYADADRRFFESTPLNNLSASFLMESRAARLGCTLSELRAMRSYDLARELADETAILGSGPLSQTCCINPTRLSEAMVDAAAKLMAAERAEAWQAFLAVQQGKGVVAKGGA